MPRPLSLSSGWLRVLIWIAVAGLVSVFVLSATRGTVLASTSLHQTPPISWDDEGFQGSEDECEDADVGAGQVLWHFVLVQTDDESADLTATFDFGVVVVSSYKKSGNVLHFEIITGEATLLGAITDGDGKWLNLSHICAGPPETTTTTTTTSTTTSSSTTTS